MNVRSILKLAKKFEKWAVQSAWSSGKDYVKQKPDGTLIVGGVRLDRDELNAMQNWQDMVDMGVDKGIVGNIAREYGGHPRNVDVWLENNSTPYTEETDQPSSHKRRTVRDDAEEAIRQVMNTYYSNPNPVYGEDDESGEFEFPYHLPGPYPDPHEMSWSIRVDPDAAHTGEPIWVTIYSIDGDHYISGDNWPLTADGIIKALKEFPLGYEYYDDDDDDEG